MKKTALVLVVLGALALSVAATAGEPGKMPAAPAISAELAQIKTLAGHWSGTSQEANGTSQPASLDYRVTSGGSAVVETLFPGTDHEMVSVYHDRNGKLEMTHYCMLGNQPELALVNGSPTQMTFDLSPNSGINTTEPHMHSLALSLPDAKHLTQTWAYFEQGKAAGTTTITLARE